MDFIIVAGSDYFSGAGCSEWPPKFIEQESCDLRDAYCSHNLCSSNRVTRIRATDKQWRAIAKEPSSTAQFASFLANANRSQLRRLGDLTPLFFDADKPPGHYVCARDFRATDTI